MITPKSINQQRIEYFDLLKGIAIFMVVMGHVLTMCVRDIDSAFTFKLISEVHMPLFFFISGYLTYKVGFCRPNLWKRFKQLIIPFVVVSALWIWYFPHSRLQSPISDNLLGMYESYWKDGYWFTLCLFEMFLIYFPLSILLKKLNNFFAQSLAILAVYALLIFLSTQFSFPDKNFDPAGLGLLTSFFPVFMIGVMARRYKSQFDKLVKGNLSLVIALLAFGGAFYFSAYWWEFPNIPQWGILIARPIAHLALMIIAIILITPWSNREFSDGRNPSVVAKYFNYLGRESLSIYLLHYFFLFPLTPLQEPLRELGLSMVPLLVLAIVCAFCVIAVTLFVSYIIERNKYLSFILIGKEIK